MRSSRGVGARAVLSPTVVLDGVDSQHLAADRDLHGAADDRYLDLASPMGVAGLVGGTSIGHGP